MPRPFITCEGGLVNDVFLPVPNEQTGETFTLIEYDILDYDIFEGSLDTDIVTHWEALSDDAKAYVKQYLRRAYRGFQAAERREKRRIKKARAKKSSVTVFASRK